MSMTTQHKLNTFYLYSLSQLVTSFVESENIPIYLQNPILWSICALFQAISDSADEQTEAGTNKLSSSHLSVSNLEGCLIGARNLTRKYRQESIKYMKKSEGVNEVGYFLHGLVSIFQVDKFTSSYKSISQNKEWNDALVRVEKSYSMAMRKLIESRDHVLESLRNKYEQTVLSLTL